MAVSDYQADPAAQLATGHFGYHMLVLQPDGTAVGWGRNDYGQVGTGGTSDVQTAQDSTALGQGNAAIALAEQHTAVIKENPVRTRSNNSLTHTVDEQARSAGWPGHGDGRGRQVDRGARQR